MAGTLEQKIKVLEDIEGVKKLRARYCYLVDARKFDEWADLFTADAVGEYGPLGTHKGREAIRKFIKETADPLLPFFMHMVHNPIIEVKGDTATGEWYFEVPATHGPTNRATWIAGKYEEEYRREGGEWKFSKIKAIFSYFTPFDEGWVKTKMMG